MLCGAAQVAPALPAPHSGPAQNNAATGHRRKPSYQDMAAWENQATRDTSEAIVSVPN